MVSVLKRNSFSGLFGLSCGRHGTAAGSDGLLLRTGSDCARAPKQLRQRLSWLQPADWLRVVRWNSDNIQTLPALPALLPSGSCCLRFLLYNPPPPTPEVRLKPVIFHAYSEKRWCLYSEIIALLALQIEAVYSSPQKTPTQTGKTNNTKPSHICTSFQGKCATSLYYLCRTPANAGESAAI